MSITTMKLSSLAEVKTGFSLRKAAESDSAGDALLVQMKDIDPFGGVDWGDVVRIATKSSKEPDWLKENDILFVGRGSRFFATRIPTPARQSLASPHFYVLRNKKADKVLPEFLVWFLNSKPAHKFYATNKEGSSLPYLSRKTLAALPIELPDIKTQKKIVNIYECWKHQHQLSEELTEQKKIYINALLENILEGEAV